MANDFSLVTPKLIAAAVKVLRENSIMPRLVNTDISEQAAMQGSSIDVPIPGELAITDVIPSNDIPVPNSVAPTVVNIPLDQWKKVDFHLTDKDRLEVVKNNLIPNQVEDAVKKIANFVDSFLLGKYVEFYGKHGTGGTTPFSNEKPTDAAQLRKVLNNQLAPMSPRHVVFNADADASALSVPAFANAEWHGDNEAILLGKLNMRLGFQWWMDQNVPEHEAGDAAGFLVNGTFSIGDSTIGKDTGTGSYNVGDLVTFAGHTQTYTVLSDAGATFVIRPGLQVAPADDAVITAIGDHVANIGFHPDAFAFASRPLQQIEAGLGVISDVAVDDISGLAIRVQLRYEHYMMIWSYDILFGGEVVRPELGARLLG